MKKEFKIIVINLYKIRSGYYEEKKKEKSKNRIIKKISESIKLLLKNLYAICEQLVIVNKALENSFLILENTYLKFLKINLKEDYIRYKKNIFFVKNLEEIRKIINLFDKLKDQFDKLKDQFDKLKDQFDNFKSKIFISGKMEFNLVFDDYIFFYNNYLKEYESINIKK